MELRIELYPGAVGYKTLNELVADGTWIKLYTQFHPGYPKPASLPPYVMKTGS
jgi:polar amino acid transport system substrate-binding protein